MDLVTNNDIIVFSGIAFCFISLCALITSLLFLRQNRKKVKINVASTSTSKTSKPSVKREVVKCPFSSEVSFVQEAADHLPPSPLDLYGDWSLHLGTRWLAAGLSGQDTPGYLRAGLKRLRHSKHFLVQDAHRIKEELLLKKKNLDDPVKHALKFVMEDDSIEAQQETLELFMAYLPDMYPQMYTYNKTDHSITVHPIKTSFRIDDWKDRPLELCERIVQEDLILMRPGKPLDDAKPGTEAYYMAAAGVVFSFTELVEKLGKPAEFIHAPVPGYEKHLRKTMNMMFSKLKPEAPLWRNNWGISPSGVLDEPLYGSDLAREQRRTRGKISEDEVKSKFLKVEYQTIRRLPRTGYLLFTVKSMVDPLHSLEEVPPRAAQCLAASIRGMSPAMRVYKGIGDDDTCQAVLSYLDSICTGR